MLSCNHISQQEAQANLQVPAIRWQLKPEILCQLRGFPLPQSDQKHMKLFVKLPTVYEEIMPKLE